MARHFENTRYITFYTKGNYRYARVRNIYSIVLIYEYYSLYIVVIVLKIWNLLYLNTSKIYIYIRINYIIRGNRN
jgi:hypothetical protein